MRFLAYLICLIGIGCQSTVLTSAKLYLQQDEVAKAKEQLLKAEALTPDDPEVHYLLATVHGQEGDLAAMIASLDRSLRLSPKFTEEAAQLRRHYWAKEYNRGITLATAAEPDLAAARQAFERAVAIDSTAAQSWRNLAFAQYRLNDLTAAIASYQRLQALAPADTAVLSNLGSLCIQEKRFAEAAQALERLTGLAPDDYRAQVNLGIAREKLGQREAAGTAFRRAVELAPDAAMAHYGLGNFLWNQSQYEGARDAYARAAELAPADTDARFNLAMSYLRLEDDGHALGLLEQLSTETPENGQVWRQLSLIYARQDRVAESKAADARATELGE